MTTMIAPFASGEPVQRSDLVASLLSLPAKRSLLGISACLALIGCGGNDSPSADANASNEQPAAITQAAVEPSFDVDPESREAFFGDLHVHTWWSFDAFSLGVRVGPEDAYAYAQGEAIDHISGEKIQQSGPPLDFIAITDHAEYQGVSMLAHEPDSPLADIPLIQNLMSDDPAVRNESLGFFAAALSGGPPLTELLGDEIAEPVWERIVEHADKHNDPGEFTAFIGFEYTSMPDGQNLHRNVIFESNVVPKRPFSSQDSPNPEDLWAWMEQARANGGDLIAIPHNANASNGLMYQRTDWSGDPIDLDYAEVRLRNEPVSEVFQIKGQSEAHPSLSPDDQFAGFEQFDRILGQMKVDSVPAGSFVREALKTGLSMEIDGFNPYRMGFIGSSDGHNASSPVEEDNYTGKIGVADHTAAQRLQNELSEALPLDAVGRWGAAGLAGVWAEENTRAALFAALRRRETFATSGPRMRLRMFAGFEFADADLAKLPASGYELGQPMGGELVAQADGELSVLAQAQADPNGAPLERLQVVKVWAGADGSVHEDITDIACASVDDLGRCASAPVVDTQTCEVDRSAGVTSFETRFVDRNYDASVPTAYYLRAIEVPTCRWSVYDAKKLGIEHPPHLPQTLQERAITSAVFVLPK